MSKSSIEKGSEKKEIKLEAKEEEFKPLSDREIEFYRDCSSYRIRRGPDLSDVRHNEQEEVWATESESIELGHQAREWGLTLKELQDILQRGDRELRELSTLSGRDYKKECTEAMKRLKDPSKFHEEYYRKFSEEKGEDMKRYQAEFSRLNPEEQKRRILREDELGGYYGPDSIESMLSEFPQKRREEVMENIIKNKIEHGVPYLSSKDRAECNLRRELRRWPREERSFDNIVPAYLEKELHLNLSQIREIIESSRREGTAEGKKPKEELQEDLRKTREETEKAFKQEEEKE